MRLTIPVAFIFKISLIFNLVKLVFVFIWRLCNYFCFIYSNFVYVFEKPEAFKLGLNAV
nr:MAG TPA: hypothetical protein [Caudoviricetes sp.]